MAKRVFFSFHYQDVIDFRANVVRQSWMVPTLTKDREEAGFFDASMWERSRRSGEPSLKRLINSGLDNTTATAVLIGSDTYARRWVRYEIMKSIERGNKVIGIHINGIKDKGQKVKTLGTDPFDHLALKISADGKRATPMEYANGQWQDYADLSPFPVVERPIHERNKAHKLATWFPVYDWISHDGYNNLGKWVA